MMQKSKIIVGALLAALANLLGAFGAHALKARADEATLNTFEIAVKYQFYHAVGILLLAALAQQLAAKWLQYSYRFFIAGTVIFCGSLYLLTYSRVHMPTPLNWLGAITPLGGICFIAGWVSLAIGAVKNVGSK
ncbi:MAG: DUF423 domain-containing protein [Bacteroidetes bacterium]|nr:MAG: DUF423 domain-containing protein [Bacteroidota bacterium]TAF91664.1 MAG: DUF423 domain-containing protein [Bacteroidota bacterium]